MNHAQYKRKKIYSFKSLGLMLGEKPDLLLKLAASCNQLYREVLQEKKDKSVRVTFDAFEPLKKVQRKIVDRLLVHVQYPNYLHGGIKDFNRPRSAFSNAKEHVSAQSIALQDITNFFPSITIDKVRDIFLGFFGFGRGVSEVLALLVTKDGFVPQGASTSSYIANLVFWDAEPELVSWVHSKGFAYTRFADDITISSKGRLVNSEWSDVISKVTGMLARKGFKQKRTKLHVLKKGQVITRDGKHEPVVVTGLGISGPSTGVVKAERNRIRAAVRQFEIAVEMGKNFEEVSYLYHSAMGRVGRMLACAQPAGLEFKKRLNEAKNKAGVPLIEKYLEGKAELEN
jgi:hypothetical protein